jgi:signal transduction histidine kinase
LHARRSDDTIFPVEISLTPISIDGNPYVAAFVADITQRNELAEQRRHVHELEIELEKERELQALKSRFVATVSHEFRTPLTVMSLLIETIQQYFEQLSKVKIFEKLTNAIEQIHYMEQMLHEVLDINKAESGVVEFMPQHIDIPTFIQNIVNNENLADTGKHNIDVTFENGTLVADPQLLTHVLSNLMSNALKYSPDNSTVTITATQANSNWHFTVQDTGIGIPESDMNRLFIPFHRATNAQNYSGTGLGLSIVKNYIEQHRGSIDITSVEGKGTTVEVVIPNDEYLLLNDG